MSRTATAFLATLMLLGSAVAQAAAAAQQPVSVTLGIYSFKKPTEVFKQFQPVAQALSRAFAANLKQPALVELQVMKSYEECLEAFLAGRIDVVRFGPASYVIAKQRDRRVQLIAAEREDSHNVGLIVVRSDSPIQKLADLAGKRFAFGDPQSTIGRYLSQAELVKAGLTAHDFTSFQFLDRHDIVFKAVELGDFEAGALHLDTFNELNEKATPKLRVLHTFDNARKPWLARGGLDAAVVTALRAGLLALDDPTALKALKVPGFAITDDADYQSVRKGMELAATFAPDAPSAPVAEPAPPPAPRKRP